MMAFHVTIRGPRLLDRGWRTPDPSPTRDAAGLPSTIVPKIVVESQDSDSEEAEIQFWTASMRLPQSETRMPLASWRGASRTPSPRQLKPGVAIANDDLMKSTSLVAGSSDCTASPSSNLDDSDIPETDVSTPRGHDSCWATEVPLPPVPRMLEQEEDDHGKAHHSAQSEEQGKLQGEGQCTVKGTMQDKMEGKARDKKGQSKGQRKKQRKGQCKEHCTMQQGILTPGLILLSPPPSAPCAQCHGEAEAATDVVQHATDLFDDDSVCAPSIGSVGHPHHCNMACKYFTKKRGCKDGDACDHCHLCKWHHRMQGKPRTVTP